MLRSVFLVCVSLSVCSAASSLSCPWLEEKFREYSESYLRLLDVMVRNSTNITELEDSVAFPSRLYDQASAASDEDKVAFTVQVLSETASLFVEDYSSASWEQRKVEDFVNLLMQQADNLRSCIGSHRRKTKLHMYFNRLRQHILKQMDYSAEAWELIRIKVKDLLMRADQLLSPLFSSN